MSDSTRRSFPKERTPEEKASGRRDRRGAAAGVPLFVVTPAVPADEVADMALRLRAEVEAKSAPRLCDACDQPIEGEPAGSGLYLWSRGEDDPRFEEPPLCEACATAIGITALRLWDTEEEEEG
jgi:hypothetical protein